MEMSIQLAGVSHFTLALCVRPGRVRRKTRTLAACVWILNSNPGGFLQVWKLLLLLHLR